MTYTQQQVDILVSEFARLDPKRLSRNQAFGIVINAKGSNGKSMQEHFGMEEALKLASAVLTELGFENSNKTTAW